MYMYQRCVKELEELCKEIECKKQCLSENVYAMDRRTVEMHRQDIEALLRRRQQAEETVIRLEQAIAKTFLSARPA